MRVLKVHRQDEGLRSIPVIMLTSSKEPRDLSRAYEVGVNSNVVKPVAFMELVSAASDIGGFWASLNEPTPRLNKSRARA